MKPFDKGSPEREMFKTYYDICVKYWNPKDSGDYWRELSEDLSKMYLPGVPSFGRELAKALQNYLEKKFIAEKKKTEVKENAET